MLYNEKIKSYINIYNQEKIREIHLVNLVETLPFREEMYVCKKMLYHLYNYNTFLLIPSKIQG